MADLSKVPATLTWPGAARFRTVALLTVVTSGVGAILLTRLLELVQRLTWGGDGRAILDAASHANPLRHVAALLGAGVITGLGS